MSLNASSSSFCSTIPLLVCALVSCLWQASPVEAQEPEDLVSIQFSCVAWERLPFEEIFYRQGPSFHRLKFQRKARSQLYSLSGVAPLALELFVQEENEEGEVGYRGIGRGPVAPGASRMLFFVGESASEEGLPLTVRGVDDSISVFPVGSFRFVNSTHVPMRVEFSGASGTLPANGMTVLEPEIPERGGFIPVYVKDLDGNILLQSRFFGQPRGRKMVFVQPPDRRGRKLQLLFLPEIVPPQPTSTPEP